MNVLWTCAPDVQTDAHAPAPVCRAAGDLRQYLRRILGGSAAGDGRITLAVRPDAALGDEGYEMTLAGRDLVIAGGGPLGAAFGAYEFLRRFCGCSFAGLGPDGEHIPERESITLDPAAFPLRRTPALWYRGLQFTSCTSKTMMLQRMDWMVRNGMNTVLFMVRPLGGAREFQDPETGEHRVIVPGHDGIFHAFGNDWAREHLIPEAAARGLKLDMNHHNLDFWIPRETYFKDHPDWFAEKDGVRGALKGPGQLCLCLSNEALVSTLIANVRAYLRANPAVSIVGVVPEDGVGFCECARCREAFVRPGEAVTPDVGFRRGAAGMSWPKLRAYALLLNRVADAVKDEFPDRRIGGAFYIDMTLPPSDVALRPTIVPMVAMYWRCGSHPLGEPGCEVNTVFTDILKTWRRTFTGRVITYSYYMGMNSQKSLPYPQVNVVCREWRTLKALGLDGASIQSADEHHNTYAANYLAFARAGWDAEVSPDAVLDEYVAGLFGRAGPALRPLFAALERAARRTAEPGGGPRLSPFLHTGYKTSPWCLAPSGHNIAYFVDTLGEPWIRRCVDEGRRLAESPREKRQVEALAAAVEYWLAAARMVRAWRTRETAREAGRKPEARQADAELRAAYRAVQPAIAPAAAGGWLSAGHARLWPRSLGFDTADTAP